MVDSKPSVRKGRRKSYRDRNTAFDYVNIVLMALLCMTIIVPFWHLLVISVSTPYYATRSGLHMIPDSVNFVTYRRVLSSHFIWTGYRATILRTIFGTIIQLFMTAMGAYVLSKTYFPNRTFWTLFIVFTMYFSGGLIPSYLLIGQLKLYDTYAAMILPGLVGTYNMILIRNYFRSIPQDLEDAALIDGAGQWTTFTRIMIPVSTPILATIALWLAVGHWNAWYDVLLYMRSDDKMTLQIILRRIVLEGTQKMLDMSSSSVIDDSDIAVSTDGLKAATIYVATLPILLVYPFIQKYFVKGIMVGSLKG